MKPPAQAAMPPARKTDYTNESQQRILSLLLVLSGHEFTGITLTDIAKHLGHPLSMLTRDLDNLATAGFAEQVPETPRWRLSPKLVQVALAFSLHLDRQHAKLDEIRQRYSARP